MNKVSNSPSDLAHDIYGSVSNMTSSMRERYDSMRERAGELYEGAREKVNAGARTTDLAIRNNPYSAIGVALGVGVLVGLLIGRSGRDDSQSY